MPAYVMGVLYDINDPAGMNDYQSGARPTIANFGGKVIAGGESVEAVEGDWAPLGFVVIEFESMAKLKTWYNSPEYQAALPLRLRSARDNFVCLNGL